MVLGVLGVVLLLWEVDTVTGLVEFMAMGFASSIRAYMLLFWLGIGIVVDSTRVVALVGQGVRLITHA